MAVFITNDPKETEQLAAEIIGHLGQKKVIALSGNLGAGKTVLVQALAKYFGVADNITSPTFVLMKVYPIRHEIFDKFVHVDCYRLDQAEDLADIGLQDYLADPKTLLLIEWAEKITKLPEELVLRIKIELLGGTKREIRLE